MREVKCAQSDINAEGEFIYMNKTALMGELMIPICE